MRDDFLHSQSDIDAVESTSELENTTEATVEFFARFLVFVVDNLDTQQEYTDILNSAVHSFTNAYLANKDVHSLTATFDFDVRETVLSSYYRALAALEERNVLDIARGPTSALLNAIETGNASAFALFGGQGTNEVYFDELQSLYDIYKPYVVHFITTLTINVLQPLATASTSLYYP